MTENRFDILTTRYLANELNATEFYELEQFINSNEYYQLKFKEYVTIDSSVNLTKTVDSNVAFNDFLNTIEKPRKIKFSNILKYAAIFVGVLFSAFGIANLLNFNNNPRTALVIPNEDIVLYNANGASKKITINNNKPIKNEHGKIEALKIGEDIIYKKINLKAPIKTINYTLKVPFGKKFGITLTDGTKVYLNSGSTLTYPNNFIGTNERIVQLQGEAYFEVAKNHKKPFIVETSNMNIRVLGTKFNVSAYKNDNTNSVTLVEGKVAVSKAIAYETETSKSILLAPNEKASIQTTDIDKKLSKNTVHNIDKHISWKNKELVFKNDKFIDISKKLQRNFNVKIVSENENLNNKEFTGRFNKQDVFEILDAFRIHTSFTYTVKNNNIILNKK